ncbi:Copper-transporting ATPase [Dionaea muscipula]
MAAKFLTFTCIRNNKESSTTLSSSPMPHYPSMPKYPKGALLPPEEGTAIEGSNSKALFSVVGMTCSACAGSVEKAIKRLPGIREAIVDVLSNRAQVLFYPSFVNVRSRASFSLPLPLLSDSEFFCCFYHVFRWCHLLKMYASGRFRQLYLITSTGI